MVIVEAAVKFGPLCIGEQSKGVNAFKAKQSKAKESKGKQRGQRFTL